MVTAVRTHGGEAVGGRPVVGWLLCLGGWVGGWVCGWVGSHSLVVVPARPPSL